MAQSMKAGSVRIIAGTWRGRKLPVVLAPDLRPTGDRVRETLFNWLQFEIEGSVWCDVFAGSGALGFEALSRQAAQVVMLEQNPKVTQQLKDNARLLNATGAKVVQTDAWHWLSTQPVIPFDGVFLDPPFKEERVLELIEMIELRNWIKPNGWLYLEQPKERVVSLASWQMHRQQTTGAVTYGLWQKKQDGDTE